MIAKPFFADSGPTALQAGCVSSKPRCSNFLGWLAIVTAALFQCAAANPFQFGDFTYQEVGEEIITITITDYPVTAVGPVVIPEEIAGKPVTAIGNEAFAGCVGITGVTIPSSVTSIADRAFFNCLAMTGVTIPVGVTSIGASAFSNCRSMLNVVIPVGVTQISGGLFQDCVALATITLPEGITSIGVNTFNNCAALTGLTIPSTVTSINSSAFIFCSSLTAITIPEGVTFIGGSCFSQCIRLASVTLPVSLTSLGTFAFSKCTSLNNVVIPNGVTVLGSSTFEDCTSLTSITLPPTLKTIGNNAFRGCTALPGIAIPAAVTSIANSSTTVDVFGSCSSLTAITVDPLNANYSSAGGVLFNKLQNTLLTFPRGLAGSYSVPSTVTTIGIGAFRYSSAVTSISIPSSVETIGSEALMGCASLTSISVDPACPNHSSLAGVLFNKNQTLLIAYPGGLSGVYAVPAGVTSISASAFRFSAGLTSVTFPASVATINSNAFASCPLFASATFDGNAPTTPGSGHFGFAASGFKIYYYSTSSGFTNPWAGSPTEQILVGSPFGSWLEFYELPTDSALSLDSNGDGVSLLLAYALDLDPTENLSGAVPQTVFTPTQMSLSYHSGAVGVTYRVEVSPDLKNWSAVGVTVTGPDANGISTATANRTGDIRFMRLSVAY